MPISPRACLIYTLRAYFAGIEDLIPWDGVQILKEDPEFERVEILALVRGREFRFVIEPPDDDDPMKGLGVLGFRDSDGGVVKGPIDPKTWARIERRIRFPL